MAATFHIHVMEPPCTEKHLRIFLATTYRLGDKGYEEAYQAVLTTANYWIGEVSWLKAALTNDEGSFIPSAVDQISDLIGGYTKQITPELVDQMCAALDAPVHKNYKARTSVDKEDLRAFLESHMGKLLFTVSW